MTLRPDSSLFLHLLQCEAIAHRGSGEWNNPGPECQFQSQVAHLGFHNAAKIDVLEPALSGDDIKDLIDNIAQVINHHSAVAITVESDAKVRTFLQYVINGCLRRG